MSNANHIQHTGAASSNAFLAIAAAYGDYTKKSFEDTKLFVEKLCGAKSLENAIEVQTEIRQNSLRDLRYRITDDWRPVR
jgi:hypothetical protein